MWFIVQTVQVFSVWTESVKMAQAVFVLMVGKDSIVNFVVVKLGVYCNPDSLKCPGKILCL